MRIPRYLSPSAISTWNWSVDDYYAKYLADNKAPRFTQTQPMAVGSSFDAFVKSYLYKRLVGDGNETYELRALFEDQVDKSLWDWAWAEGQTAFDSYKQSGCLANLVLEMSKAIAPPRFEFTLEDTVNLGGIDVPLLGKPDLFYTNAEGARVILDWKVNGWCATRNVSPAKGYVRLWPGDKIHRDCILSKVHGVTINVAQYLEDANKSWADQLSVYSWLLGEPVGSEKVIVGIDQLVGNPARLRIATHRVRIKPNYQFELAALISEIWETIQSGYIFRDLSEAESKAKCELLDNYNPNSELAKYCG